MSEVVFAFSPERSAPPPAIDGIEVTGKQPYDALQAFLDNAPEADVKPYLNDPEAVEQEMGRIAALKAKQTARAEETARNAIDIGGTTPSRDERMFIDPAEGERLTLVGGAGYNWGRAAELAAQGSLDIETPVGMTPEGLEKHPEISATPESIGTLALQRVCESSRRKVTSVAAPFPDSYA